MNYYGADFATTLGGFGFRGEFAYRKSQKDYLTNVFIPNPDLQYIIGGDKEFGDFSVIFQYIGRYVFDFKELAEPENILEIMSYELTLKNRMLTSQLERISHGISFRPALKCMYETVTLELIGYYNVSTEEIYIKPKATYAITDALTCTLGGELYDGPEQTLFGLMNETLSSLFIELKAFF